MRRDELAHHVEDARDEGSFRQAAIGEGGIVGRVDIPGIGTGPAHRFEHGETTEAGIEQQDRRLRCRDNRGEGQTGASHQVDPHRNAHLSPLNG